MSFNYHTGYIPGVMEEEMHKRRIRHRVYIVLLIVVGLVFYWMTNKGQNESQDVTQDSLQNAPQGIIITSPSESESSTSSRSLDSLKTLKSPKQMSQEDAKEIAATAPVTDKSNKLENTPGLEKNYEKEIDLIINKAFSSQ